MTRLTATRRAAIAVAVAIAIAIAMAVLTATWKKEMRLTWRSRRRWRVCTMGGCMIRMSKMTVATLGQRRMVGRERVVGLERLGRRVLTERRAGVRGKTRGLLEERVTLLARALARDRAWISVGYVV